MLIWAVYDIANDKRRRKLAKALKDAGLYRVQKSVFLGNLQRNRLDELALKCRDFVKEDGDDALYLFPMCESDFRYTLSLGRVLDRELVNDELLAVVV